MKLMIHGSVIRSAENGAAVAIQRHGFRTQGRSTRVAPRSSQISLSGLRVGVARLPAARLGFEVHVARYKCGNVADIAYPEYRRVGHFASVMRKYRLFYPSCKIPTSAADFFSVLAEITPKFATIYRGETSRRSPARRRTCSERLLFRISAIICGISLLLIQYRFKPDEAGFNNLRSGFPTPNPPRSSA
jgi:hypothetical protein